MGPLFIKENKSQNLINNEYHSYIYNASHPQLRSDDWKVWYFIGEWVITGEKFSRELDLGI